MSSDETTTSNKKLPAAPELMGLDTIDKLDRMELLKLIAATLNVAGYEDHMKYKDIALNPCDLDYAISRFRYGIGGCKDFNEVNDFLRIGRYIINHLNCFKATLQCMIDDAQRVKEHYGF